MKRKLLLLLMPFILCGSPTLAHDIEVDGIYYVYTNNKTELQVSFRGKAYSSYDYEYTGNVIIPDSVAYGGKTFPVTSIGDYTFFGNTGVTSVTIPNSVKSIGVSAFGGCKGLVSITIPNSVTTIEGSAFNTCTNLMSVVIPNSVTFIGSSAFNNCTNLASVVIPNTITSIKYRTFFKCISLTSVTIPNSVTTLGESAFSYCSGLTSVTIPNSVTSIGSGAFRGCSSLISIIIPNSVASIEEYAFIDCPNIKRIVSYAIEPPMIAKALYHAFRDIDKSNCQVYVPEISLSAYKSADVWKEFKFINALAVDTFFINTLTSESLVKEMFELRNKSDSIIASYNSNYVIGLIENDKTLSQEEFTTPPTGILTSASQLSSNAKATNEGSYEALLDGNQTTFFHTTWLSGSGDAPDEDHYLQIDLQEEVERIALKYGARGSITNYVNPNNITIYATNNVNGSWEQITTATLTYDSNGKGLLSIYLGGKYRYIRISVQNSTLGGYSNGHAYWCLGELRIYNLGTENDQDEIKVPNDVIENLKKCIISANSEIYSNAATQSTYDALLSAYNTFLGYMTESTDIEHIRTTPSVDIWFDLQGRRIAKPQTSGIYIHNGKKVWVK